MQTWRRLLPSLCVALACSFGHADDNDDRDEWIRHRADLNLHPVGYSLSQRKFTFDTIIPMHPSGFAAERYSLFPGPAFGLGRGWEVGAHATLAETLGVNNTGILNGRAFYGAGLQKQLTRGETLQTPALALGGYGWGGPGNSNGGMVYAVVSKQLSGVPEGKNTALFAHLGVKLEMFDNLVGNSSGVRPFLGANLSFSRLVFFSGEISPRQAWEFAHQYSISGTYLLYKRRYGVTAGVQNNGYRGKLFVGVAL